MQWGINSTTLKTEAEGSSEALVPIPVYKSTCVALHTTVLFIAVLSS